MWSASTATILNQQHLHICMLSCLCFILKVNHDNQFIFLLLMTMLSYGNTAFAPILVNTSVYTHVTVYTTVTMFLLPFFPFHFAKLK